ncbi:hypothetical protein N185_15825 [Sinorhizobium sp. GW3]|nr:hypothetical protein N185_15825 [Sinorhizobium sp. GW3]
MPDILDKRLLDDRAQSGFALLAVLGLMMLVSILLISFSTSARLRALTADNALRAFSYAEMGDVITRHVAERILTAGNIIPVRMLRIPDTNDCVLGEYSILLAVQDHAGLIDLNAAGLPLIAVGFQSLGFSKEQAASLALATDSYRRSDRKLSAGSDPAIPYKHATFEDVSELLDFPELQTFSPADISGVFTVQSQAGTLSMDAASDAVRSVASAYSDGVLPLIALRTRPRALTVVASIRRGETFISTSAAIFRYAGNKVVYAGAVSAQATELPGDYLPCRQFMDASMLAAIGEVLQ